MILRFVYTAKHFRMVSWCTGRIRNQLIFDRNEQNDSKTFEWTFHVCSQFTPHWTSGPIWHLLFAAEYSVSLPQPTATAYVVVPRETFISFQCSSADIDSVMELIESAFITAIYWSYSTSIDFRIFSIRMTVTLKRWFTSLAQPQVLMGNQLSEFISNWIRMSEFEFTASSIWWFICCAVNFVFVLMAMNHHRSIGPVP